MNVTDNPHKGLSKQFFELHPSFLPIPTKFIKRLLANNLNNRRKNIQKFKFQNLKFPKNKKKLNN